MRSHRFLRLLPAILAMVGVLFAQLGVAAHACAMPADESIVMESETGSPCGGMVIDHGQPALCQAHCQQGDQSLDKPLTPLLGPVTGLGAWAIDVAFATPPEPPPREQPSLLARATGPSVAVRHCRFRT